MSKECSTPRYPLFSSRPRGKRPAGSYPLRRRDGSVAAITLIDTDLHWLISRHSWSLARDRHGYVCAQTNIEVNGKRTTMKLQHLIKGKPLPGCCIDHINGNPLDNRRENLRVCTRQENAQNQTSVRGKVKYRGVYKNGRRFRAALTHGGKRYNLGTYDTPEEAAMAYNVKTLELRGEFAALNVLPEGYVLP